MGITVLDDEVEKFNEGGMWEFPEWELRHHEECGSSGGGKPCKHCVPLPFTPQYRADGSVWNQGETYWICPRVIVSKNEDGNNTTGLCADCVLEKLAE